MKKLSLTSVVLVVVGLIMSFVLHYAHISSKTTESESSVSAVAVDTTNLFSRGELIVYDGVGFVHEYDIVDYVPADPGQLVPTEDVVGIFVRIPNGSNKVENKAVLEDGRIVALDTEYRLLPRANSFFSLKPAMTGNTRQILLSRDLNGLYNIAIPRQQSSAVQDALVVDAWASHDAAYWMTDSGNVYRLKWSSTEPELFCSGANAVSHHSDEAQGALVPYPEANHSAYGRSDIYSPYNINIVSHTTTGGDA